MGNKIEKELKFNEDSKLTELKRSYRLWQEILSKIETAAKSPPVQSNKLYSGKQIRDAIINLLDTKGKEGTNSRSLFSILKKSFLNGYSQIRHELTNLINEGTIVKIIENKSNILLLREHYTEKPRHYLKKIFGRPLIPLSHLEEISLLEKGSLSSKNNNRVSRLAGLFLVRYFRVREPSKFEGNYDFVAEKNDDRVYIRIEDNLEIMHQQLHKIYETLPKGSSGIIITLNSVEEDVRNFSKGLSMEIWDRAVLLRILAECSYEPCHTDTLVKVMYGPNGGRYARVRHLHFGNQTQEIQFIDDFSHSEVFFGSLRPSDPNSNVSRHEDAYTYFIQILRSICSPVEFHTGLKLTPPTKAEYHTITRYPNTMPENIVNRYDTSIIETFIDSCRVFIRFDVTWNGFIYLDEDNHNDTPRDFCRRYVLRCQCYYWLDQDSDTIRLCRHIIAALNGAWHKAYDVNHINKGIQVIRFFCHDSFILHDFLQRVAQTRNTDIYELIKNVFLLKSTEEFKDSNLEQLIAVCNQNSGRRSISFKDSAGLMKVITLGIVENETLEELSKLKKEFPTINEVIARMPNIYANGCKTTLEEMVYNLPRSDHSYINRS
jgi:hypothetical protein